MGGSEIDPFIIQFLYFHIGSITPKLGQGSPREAPPYRSPNRRYQKDSSAEDPLESSGRLKLFSPSKGFRFYPLLPSFICPP